MDGAFDTTHPAKGEKSFRLPLDFDLISNLLNVNLAKTNLE
jgi:hypothetical protein